MDGLKGVLRAAIFFSIIGTVFFTCIGLTDTKTSQIPEPTSYFFIDDYSSVFTEETENAIFEAARKLYEKSGAQICVVSVPDTQADILEDYSLKLANSWGIGNAGEDNGVLILFTTDDPHVRIEVGKGLEGCLPDSKAGRILDEWAVEDKEAGRWNRAARNTFTAVAEAVYEEYGLTPPDDLVYLEETEERVEESTMADAAFPEMLVEKNHDPLLAIIAMAFVMTWLFGIIPFLIFLFVWKFIMRKDFEDLLSLSALRSGEWTDHDSFGGGGFSGDGGSFGGGGASR